MSSVPLSAVRSVIFTMNATEAKRAGAGVAVDTVSAVGSVLTGVALTLVDVLLAPRSAKAGRAGAQEAVHLVITEPSVATGVCRWKHQTQLYVLIVLLVCTFINGHEEETHKGRRTDELTGLAVVNVVFTVASGKARFAAAVVTAQSVLAGCSIATGILHTLFDVHLAGLA